MPWPSISDLRLCVSLRDFRKRGPTQARFCQVHDVSFHTFRKGLYAPRPPPILHDQLLKQHREVVKDRAVWGCAASVAHAEVD